MSGSGARRHWQPDDDGFVTCWTQGRPALVHVTRLDAIRDGQEAARFYSEWCAAVDIDLDPSYGRDLTGKAGPTARPPGRRPSAAPAVSADKPLGLFAA